MADLKRGFPSSSHWFLAAVLAVTAMIIAPGVALADPLGSAISNGAPCSEGTGADAIPAPTAPNYSLPADGTITGWSIQAQADPTATTITVRFELWRPKLLPDGVTYEYALVAIDGPTTIPNDGQVYAYTVAIDGQKGDIIGLGETGPTPCGVWTGNSGDAYQTFDDTGAVDGTYAPTIRQDPGTPWSGYELDVAATFVKKPDSQPLNVPATKDDCLDRHWGVLVDKAGTEFKNQGDCVSYVENGNPAAGI
jgi:hypothetical protein